MFFGKHISHLSEILWEDLEGIWSSFRHLVSVSFSSASMLTRAPALAAAVYKMTQCLDNCIGFLDGTVLGVARPGSLAAKNFEYNGHRRKHALKLQMLTGQDGMLYHGFGPMEGRIHDWTLYTRSGLNKYFRVRCMWEEGNFVYTEIHGTIDAFTLKIHLKGKPQPLKNILTNL